MHYLLIEGVSGNDETRRGTVEDASMGRFESSKYSGWGISHMHQMFVNLKLVWQLQRSRSVSFRNGQVDLNRNICVWSDLGCYCK